MKLFLYTFPATGSKQTQQKVRILLIFYVKSVYGDYNVHFFQVCRMNIPVSSELFGKDHKIDVWLTHKPDLEGLRNEIEKSLQTEAVLNRPKGQSASVSIALGELQVYDVEKYSWVLLESVDQVSHRSQIFAEVIENGASSQVVQSTPNTSMKTPGPKSVGIASPRRSPITLASPLTRLPVPAKDLPINRRNHLEGIIIANSPARRIRCGSPARSLSPSRVPRYVPPPVQVATNIKSKRSGSPASDGGTAWQGDVKKPFRGYHISGDSIQFNRPRDFASARGDSPSPFDRLSRDEVVVTFPIGAEVIYEGTGDLHGQRGLVIAHDSRGRIEVDIEGALISIPPSRIRLAPGGLCALQSSSHDCQLSPRRRAASPSPYNPYDGSTENRSPQNLKSVIESQEVVFNHTLAKHQAIVLEERSNRKRLERSLKLTQRKLVQTVSSNNMKLILRKYLSLWFNFITHNEEEQTENEQKEPTEDDVECKDQPKTVDQQDDDDDEYDSERRVTLPQLDTSDLNSGSDVPLDPSDPPAAVNVDVVDQTKSLFVDIRNLKVLLAEKETEIYQSQQTISTLQQQLEEAHQALLSKEHEKTEEDESAGSDHKDDKISETPKEVTDESFEREPSVLSETPTSPLAAEFSEVHKKMTEYRMEIDRLKNELKERPETTDNEPEPDQNICDSLQSQLDAANTNLDKTNLENEAAQQEFSTKLSVKDQEIEKLNWMLNQMEQSQAAQRDSKTTTLPWLQQQHDDEKRLTAAKKKHKQAVDRVTQLRKEPTAQSGRGRTRSPNRRRSSSLTETGTPKQVHHYPVGSQVTFGSLDGRPVIGWVVGHTKGRLEIQTDDGIKHPVLPSRIKDSPKERPIPSQEVNDRQSSTPSSIPRHTPGRETLDGETASAISASPANEAPSPVCNQTFL